MLAWGQRVGENRVIDLTRVSPRGGDVFLLDRRLHSLSRFSCYRADRSGLWPSKSIRITSPDEAVGFAITSRPAGGSSNGPLRYRVSNEGHFAVDEKLFNAAH